MTRLSERFLSSPPLLVESGEGEGPTFLLELLTASGEIEYWDVYGAHRNTAAKLPEDEFAKLIQCSANKYKQRHVEKR